MFANVVGGVKVLETSADLALLLAIVSSYRDRILPRDMVIFGEVGLSGEIRPVPSGQERLSEAAKHGFNGPSCPGQCTERRDQGHAGDRGGQAVRGARCARLIVKPRGPGYSSASPVPLQLATSICASSSCRSGSIFRGRHVVPRSPGGRPPHAAGRRTAPVLNLVAALAGGMNDQAERFVVLGVPEVRLVSRHAGQEISISCCCQTLPPWWTSTGRPSAMRVNFRCSARVLLITALMPMGSRNYNAAPWPMRLLIGNFPATFQRSCSLQFAVLQAVWLVRCSPQP